MTSSSACDKPPLSAPWLNWIEQPPPKGQVAGSNPAGVTRILRAERGCERMPEDFRSSVRLEDEIRERVHRSIEWRSWGQSSPPIVHPRWLRLSRLPRMIATWAAIAALQCCAESPLWADCVEKLLYSALGPNLGEQNSELLRFRRRHAAQSARRRTVSHIPEICSCSKEFFNRIGRERFGRQPILLM